MTATSPTRLDHARRAQRIDEICAHWIGISAPPAHRVLDEASWKPDPQDAYCTRCGVSVGPGEATETGCGSCRGRTGIADGVVRLGAYADQLRDWVIQVKYRGWTDMGRELGMRLGRAVGDSGLAGDATETVVVPMPMPWPRKLYRGIDHARVIASGAARSLEAPLVSVLGKRNGPPQVSLPTSQRRRGGAQGLKVRSVWRWVPNAAWIRGATVLLVDDVCTTGATLRAAARLLRPFKPGRVIAGVVAVADDSARRRRSGDPKRIEEPVSS